MSDLANLPQLRRKGNGWELLVDGKPFIMLSGEVHNSSASTLQYMKDHVWDAVTQLNCNSLIVPIYWELFEPEEGQFDYSLLDGLVVEAGKRNMKLVLLWFATWKNSFSTYTPEWVKTDVKRFFRMEFPDGKKMPRISYFCEAARNADAKAFSTLMKRIRGIDEGKQTVIMVQIQNEVGILGADRDYSAQANESFQMSVPEELMTGIMSRKGSLRPEVADAWQKNGMRESGTWKDIFGELAEEMFSAWHFAKYIEFIAIAGSDEYALPMFVNAWLVQREGQPAGEYPGGGPVTKMIDVWQIAAPTICLTAPDIYLDDFDAVCADYRTADNPLLIPEAKRDATAAANVFSAIGKHQALCFAPFGIESMVSNQNVDIRGNSVADASFNIQNYDNGKMLAQSYALLQGMSALISDCYGTDKIAGILQKPGIEKENLSFGDYVFEIEYSSPHEKMKTPGAGLLIKLSEHEFIIAGHGFMAHPVSSIRNKDNIVEIVLIEEGSFLDEKWQTTRRLNGDEYRCILPPEPSVRRLKLFNYQ